MTNPFILPDHSGVRYYDLVGSATYLSLIACSVGLTDTEPRGWLLAGAVVVWALRLGSFLFLRIHRAGSDRRFDEVKQSFGPFLVAWSLQALWVFLTLCCALAAITSVTTRPGAPGTPRWSSEPCQKRRVKP